MAGEGRPGASVYALLDHMLENEENVAGIGIASIGPVKVKEGIIAHPFILTISAILKYAGWWRSGTDFRRFLTMITRALSRRSTCLETAEDTRMFCW